MKGYTVFQSVLFFRPPRQYLHASLTLIAFLQWGNLPALAQTGDRDYYAPRTNNEQVTLLKNVEDYHLGPGQEKMAKRFYPSAQQEFEFILRYFPNHPKALSLLSDLCWQWPVRTCNADAWFEKAIKRNPDVSHTYLVYGIHLHRKKQLKEAVQAYRRALELAPDSMNTHYNLGLAYTDLQQYDLANQHAQTSYQLGAFTPGLRNRLEKVGKWNPTISAPPSDVKRAGEPVPEVEKTPD